MTALTLLFLLLAVAAVGFAVYAQVERLLAQSRQLAAQSANLKAQSPALLTRAILLAVDGETVAAEMRRALLYAPPPPGTLISVEGANEWLGRYRGWFDELREQAIEKSGDDHVSK